MMAQDNRETINGGGMVEGTRDIVLVCMAGGLVGEFVRILGYLREGKWPNGPQLAASLLAAALGALGVLLVDAETGRKVIELMVLGSAFPMIFSGLVAATTKKHTGGADVADAASGRPAGVADYLAGRAR